MSRSQRLRRAAVLGLVGSLAAAGVVLVNAAGAAPGAGALTGLNTSADNRRAPVGGLYDWSRAGYRGGQNLPGAAETNPAAACQITAAELASQFDVRPNDGVDDSAGIQSAIDSIRSTCSPSASYTKLSLITLPAGER